MGEKIKARDIIVTNSPVKTMYKISLEYNFSDPKFEMIQCNTSGHMPIFVATCEIQKGLNTYKSTGEYSKIKKRSQA